MNFDEAFHELLGHEGGYSNHPSDPGAETMWGVTAAVARRHGYLGAMRELPLDRAKAIYRTEYWDAVQADQLPAVLRYDVFDAAVNSGPTQAAKWLQRAVGATPDGAIGPKTIAAARTADLFAVMRMNGERLEFMTDLKNWPAFGKGWARRISKLMRMVR